METLYDILEVSRKASKEIIEKAYKTLAKKYHPDVQSVANKASAEEMMKKINHAYDVLSDDEKRREYDKQLEEQEEQKEQEKQTSHNYNAYTNNSENMNYNNQNNIYDKQTYTNNPENMNYNNQSNMYNQKTYANRYNSNNYEKQSKDWRDDFANLSEKEQKKVIKQIRKEAGEEYRKQYEAYFRNLGFRIKHRWTFKDFLVILLVITILLFIIYVLWLIPSTHEVLAEIYEENFFIKLIVDICKGMFQGIIRFCQNILRF